MQEISTEDYPQVEPRFVFQVFFLTFLIFALSTTVLYFVLWDITFVFLSMCSWIMIPVTRQLGNFAARYKQGLRKLKNTATQT